MNNIDFTEHMVDEYLPDEGDSARIELAMLGSHEDASRAEFAESSDSDIPSLLDDDDSESDEILEDITEVGTRWSRFLNKHYVHDHLGDARANTYTWMLELARDLGLPIDESSTADLRAQLEDRYRQFKTSARTFRVQGRSDQWRADAEKRLKKQGVTDETERTLRALAESIVAPAGITYEHLAHLQSVSEPQIKMLLVAWGMANHTPPRVDVPFSPGSSGRNGGRRSS